MKLDPKFIIREGILMTALISSDLELIHEVEQRLSETFGPYELESDLFSFDAFTGYYAEEMGSGLQKKFLSFQKMIRVETLAEIKHFTNKVEEDYAVNGKRRINIDPGYVTHAQMVLATTKPFSHRLYLGEGIFAELTYLCKGKRFLPFEWTYPDYRKEWAIDFFQQVRQCYLRQTRANA